MIFPLQYDTSIYIPFVPSFVGDRVFPPQSGLSYSTWFSVEKFSDPRSDPHCVRLLTLVRNLPGHSAHLVCLVVCLSARDKALIVTTQEVPLPHQGQGISHRWPCSSSMPMYSY